MNKAVKKPTVMWVIAHPLLPNKAYVLADNWELATVAAAEYWGVPWTKIAADCVRIESHTARRNVCIRCRAIYYGDGPMCAKCEAVAKADKRNTRFAAQKYWHRQMREWKERQA